eukprot:1157454-Pyramimonas_sp.AAC.1
MPPALMSHLCHTYVTLMSHIRHTYVTQVCGCMPAESAGLLLATMQPNVAAACLRAADVSKSAQFLASMSVAGAASIASQ